MVFESDRFFEEKKTKNIADQYCGKIRVKESCSCIIVREGENKSNTSYNYEDGGEKMHEWLENWDKKENEGE